MGGGGSVWLILWLFNCICLSFFLMLRTSCGTGCISSWVHLFTFHIFSTLPYLVCSRRRNRPVKKIFPSTAPIKPGTPGSVIERHSHEAKRSGSVSLVNYAPYIFTHISIICTSLCRTTTLLHPTMKHLYQMFSTIPRLFCETVAIASPLSSDGSHPGINHQM